MSFEEFLLTAVFALAAAVGIMWKTLKSERDVAAVAATARMDELERRADRCEEDRAKLRERVALLEGRECPVDGCPLWPPLEDERRG